MAQIEWVDRRLREWAQWLAVGDGSGYASVCTLSKDWSPPTPGTTPTLKVSRSSQAVQTHRAVMGLSERLQMTLKLHYCTQLSAQERALRLECQVVTLEKRLWAAHAALAAVMT